MKNIFGTIFSKKISRVWLIVTAAVLSLFIVINVLACTTFYTVIASVLGGKRAVYDGGTEAIYQSDYQSKAETLDAANKFNQTIAEEGSVLLMNKNDALPVRTPQSVEHKASARPKVSVFGKNSVNLAYGGTGSGGAMQSQLADRVDLYTALDVAGYDANPELKSFYESSASGPVRTTSTDMDSGNTVVYSTAETPQSSYTADVKASYDEYSDMAIVVITRQGGEGADMPRSMKGADGAREESDHFLQLDKNETDLLAAVCNGPFEKVVLLLNIASVMESWFLTDPDYYAYQENIDAALWIGYPGNTGTLGVCNILNGNVNPSGRTVDTWSADFKADPTWNNFGESQPGYDELRVNGSGSGYYFVDYEESVYVGYKYYETRGFDEDRAGNESWYDDNVIYPFGYGLSYADFVWEVDDSSVRNVTIDGQQKYEITVTVTNTGDVAGKDVVELYAHAPYYYFGIEKPYVTLVDFAKTPLIEPGKSMPVTLTFDPYYLASYDYNDANGNGFSGYELEAYDKELADSAYCLFVAQNSHDFSRAIPFSVPEDGIKYRNDPVTGETVVNRYTGNEDARYDSDYHITSSGSQYLTRGDWGGTMPVSPVTEDRDEREVSDQLISFLGEKHNTDFDYKEPEQAASFGKELVVTYRDMLYNEGVYAFGEDDDELWKAFTDYNDGRWEYLLDAADSDELLYMLNYGAFQSAAVPSIGKPLTNDTDGPSGFVNFMLTDGTYWGTCYYASQIVVASSWSEELAQGYGEMVGNEGLWGADGRGNGMPYSGWYAPGVNIHRSPFGGRNHEYFSEDGVLSGKLAAAEIRGCQSKGVYCFVKHFAVNDQETHRSSNGGSVWLNEQSLRETYLRAFEIVVKEGQTRAIMSSFNRIGGVWTGGDYRLLTEILRGEWGFNGTVVTDFTSGAYMDARQMAYAGGDLNLNNQEKYIWSDFDKNSAEDVAVLRRCAKDVLYTVLHSNAMNGEISGYAMPVWQICLIVADCVIVAGLGVWGFFAIKKAFRKNQQQ